MKRFTPLPLVLVLLPFATASAQSTAQLPATLTLQQALGIARENNPAYRIQQAELEVADAQERSARVSLLPAVTVGLSTGFSQSRTFTGEDPFGQPVRRDDPLVFTSTRSGQNLSFGSITLFDGGTRVGNARAMRLGAEATRAGVDADRVRLEAQLARAYFEAVRADRRIELEERLLESARADHEAALRLLRVGVQDPVDILGAEVAVAEREHSLDRARGEARKTRLALAEAMGLGGQEIDFALADELPTVFDPATLDGEALAASALRSSPILTQLEAQNEAARHQLSAVRARRLPTVTLSASAGRSAGASGYDALFEINPLNQSYGLSLNLSLPVFDGFQTSREVAQARAGQTAATENLRARQLQTESEIRGALIDLENAYRSVQLADRSAELNRERLELAQEKYRLGSMSFTDLQRAADSAADTEHAALTARFDFVTALVGLEERVGVRVR